MMEVTEKDIEKLAAIADLELYVILYAPDAMPSGEVISEEEKRYHMRAFSTVHYYFARLTLDALQDRKRAEWLAPIFERLEQRMIVYTGALGSFAQILQTKHGIKGELPQPPREMMEKGIKHFMQMPYEIVMAGHERVRQKENAARKEGLRELMENIMFL